MNESTGLDRRAIKVLIAAGASAGHLYPALAFAEDLLRRRPLSEVAFVSSVRSGLEETIRGGGYRLFLISIRPLIPCLAKLLPSLYCLVKSFLESFFIIESFRPDVVVGFGSYISFPVLLEAALFKKATLIHEQNASLGLANKILSLLVDKVVLSFKRTSASNKSEDYGLAPSSQSHKYVLTGYPLRPTFRPVGLDKARGFFSLDEKFTILVAGGSQGAHKINTEFSKAVRLLEKRGDFQFIHISGKSDYSYLKKSYACITMKHCLFDFLIPMHLAYSLADLVICRAGAGTIFELASFHKAAILIPYPYAAGHQLENAMALEKENAALVIQEKELGPLGLSENIIRLMASKLERGKLEDNIQKFATPDAGDRLAELALSLIANR